MFTINQYVTLHEFQSWLGKRVYIHVYVFICTYMYIYNIKVLKFNPIDNTGQLPNWYWSVLVKKPYGTIQSFCHERYFELLPWEVVGTWLFIRFFPLSVEASSAGMGKVRNGPSRSDWFLKPYVTIYIIEQTDIIANS